VKQPDPGKGVLEMAVRHVAWSCASALGATAAACAAPVTIRQATADHPTNLKMFMIVPLGLRVHFARKD
jgi:Na+/glutamate symporter